MRFIAGLFNFAKNLVASAFKCIGSFIKEVVTNTESIIILSLATIGAVLVIKELPFWVALPLWIETPVAIGVVAVLSVLSLVTIMEMRTRTC